MSGRPIKNYSSAMGFGFGISAVPKSITPSPRFFSVLSRVTGPIS